MKRILLSVLIFALCTPGPLSALALTGTLQQIDKTGEIRIGYQESLPPMSFLDTDGQPAGYSIDLCQQIVTEVEDVVGKAIAVKYVPVVSKDRFDALVDNKIDILCGSTTKTISRSERVDFTQLTFVTGASFLHLRKTDLKNNFEGKRLGANKGTTTADALRGLLDKTAVKATIVLFKSAEEGLKALDKGEIDAYASDQVVLIGLALRSGHPEDYSVLPSLFTYEPLALAVRRNDADFRLVADRVIARLYRTREIMRIYDRWFGEFSRTPAFDALIQINAIPE